MQQCPHDVVHVILGWTQEFDPSSYSEAQLRVQMWYLREEQRKQQIGILRICTLVCRNLANVARTMLFQDIYINYGTNAMEKCTTLLELVAQDSSIAQWIHRVTITSGSANYPRKPLFENDVTSVSIALCQKLVEVRTLVFKNINLQELEPKMEAIQIFRCLRSVTSLHFRCVRFSSLECVTAIIESFGGLSHLDTSDVQVEVSPSSRHSFPTHAQRSLQNIDLSHLSFSGWCMLELANNILSPTQPLRLRIQTTMFRNEQRYAGVLVPLNKILPRLTGLSLAASNDCGGLRMDRLIELCTLELHDINHGTWAASILLQLTNVPKLQNLYLTFPYVGTSTSGNAVSDYSDTQSLDTALHQLGQRLRITINLHLRAELASRAMEVSEMQAIFANKLPRAFKSTMFLITYTKLRPLELACEDVVFWTR